MQPSSAASAHLALLLAAVLGACAAPLYDAPIDCAACDGWNQPHAPFRIASNTWYVGVAGLTALLIDTGEGLVLVDGGLPQSAPLIDSNIRTLEFRPGDVEFILVSHVHYDHVGGIAALQRITGARVLTSEAARQALAAGELQPDDPQFDPDSDTSRFPVVGNISVVSDGETLTIGDIELTGYHTPGHTPGGMSWSWRSCSNSGCLDIVYADSLSPVSVDGYRFSADNGRVAQQLRASAARIGALPCDIFLGNHPSFFGMSQKLDSDAPEPFVNAGECRAYAERALARLERRLHEETGQ